MQTPFARIVEVSAAVTAAAGRLEKTGLLAELLRSLAPDEVAIAVSYLSGDLPQGRIGIGPAAIRAAWPDAASAADAPLAIHDVDDAFTRIAGLSGAGSTAGRARLLRGLLERASGAEQDFLGRLLFGELRQGAQEGVMLDAVAKAAGVRVAEVRRAHMMAGDLPAVARAVLEQGSDGLAAFGVRLFRPLQPMLAQSADDVGAVLARLGEAAFEYKLDGARVQIHRAGDDVRIYTRRLHDVTASAPEIVEAVRALPVREVVLDGEAIALRRDGSPLPFQDTMRRFSRKLDIERQRAEVPLHAFLFDCLHLDGDALLDRSAAERFAALDEIVPAALRVPRIRTASGTEAAGFMDAARAAGHEGLLAKALDTPYEAGRRGRGWIKVKPANTLDLVVLAAEWGHGRRRGWLSNLHLGARDPATGGFVMLGKTFKGMTDDILEWQTRTLPALETARDDYTVHVRPELVVEIAFNEIQASPRYPGGVALRFARLKGYRPDKSAAEADTIETVRALYAKQIAPPS
jgi:DNA ligase 1